MLMIVFTIPSPQCLLNGFKKLAVQWFNEVLCFVSSPVLADSFVLRNRQLLKPAKRYGQPGDSVRYH